MLRRKRKPEPGVIVIDLRPVFAGFAAIAQAARDAVDAMARLFRPPPPPPRIPHCRRHGSHELACHHCLNALAGLVRPGGER